MSSTSSDADCLIEFAAINSVPVQTVQFGLKHSIFKSFEPINKSPKAILIFIPGEVGDLRFYASFLQSIHKRTNLPTLAIAHAGHSNPGNELVFDCFAKSYKPCPSFSFARNPSLYTVHGQVRSKLVCLKKFLPPKIKTIFIAHGIGCYLTLQMLNSYPLLNDTVLQIHMISPTIENVRLTRVGSTYLQNFKPFKCSVIDRLAQFYRGLALFYLSWLFRLLCLDWLIFFLYKKIFVYFFGNDYTFAPPHSIPFLVLLLEDAVSLIQDTNASLMSFLSSKIRLIYFDTDQLSYHFFNSANKRNFPALASSFLVAKVENLVGQSKLLIKKCYLSKKLKKNFLKELDEILKSDKTLSLIHDFQTNELISKLLSLHIAVEVLAKLSEPPTKRSGYSSPPKLHQTFESKEDSNVKSVSRLMMRK